jgi:hypothetical protein
MAEISFSVSTGQVYRFPASDFPLAPGTESPGDGDTQCPLLHPDATAERLRVIAGREMPDDIIELSAIIRILMYMGVGENSTLFQLYLLHVDRLVSAELSNQQHYSQVLRAHGQPPLTQSQIAYSNYIHQIPDPPENVHH